MGRKDECSLPSLISAVQFCCRTPDAMRPDLASFMRSIQVLSMTGWSRRSARRVRHVIVTYMVAAMPLGSACAGSLHVADQKGLLHALCDASHVLEGAMLKKGVSLGDITGTGMWALPMPAAIVIGTDRALHSQAAA